MNKHVAVASAPSTSPPPVDTFPLAIFRDYSDCFALAPLCSLRQWFLPKSACNAKCLGDRTTLAAVVVLEEHMRLRFKTKRASKC